MSQASELLNDLENQRIATSAGPEPHIVVGTDRFVTVPTSLKRLAVQGDHNIETVTFDCPRYWDNLDLYSMEVFVNYVRSDGVLGSFEVENKTIDESDENLFHFTWTISGNVTKVHGKLRFIICAKVTDEFGEDVHHWHSELNDETYISEGLDCGDSIAETLEPDIVMQILTRLDNTSLIGTTVEITPAQVIEAIKAGKTLAITHDDANFGSLIFNSFVVAVSDNAVQASGVFVYGGTWLAAALIGDSSGGWLLTMTPLQTAST